MIKPFASHSFANRVRLIQILHSGGTPSSLPSLLYAQSQQKQTLHLTTRGRRVCVCVLREQETNDVNTKDQKSQVHRSASVLK